MLADPPLSKETVYRLGKRGEIVGYLMAGRRLWTLELIRAYRERQIKKGPQFAPDEVEKRRPGRPRKPEAASASAG